MTEPHRRTYGHERVQIVAQGTMTQTNGHAPADAEPAGEGTLHRGRRGWIMTFSLPNWCRVLGISCIVSIPEKLEEGAKAPVYIRFRIDWNQEDRPGSVTIG